MASSVLVVDDDPNLVRLMSKFLKLEGFAPVPAANGLEALAYLRGGGDASVILLDLRMPVMDGWTFRREQRGDPGLAGIPSSFFPASKPDAVQDMEPPRRSASRSVFLKSSRVVRRLCESYQN